MLYDKHEQWQTEHAHLLAHYEACEFAKETYNE